MSGPVHSVLIVEDDADSAAILEAYLLRDGFRVHWAGDGARGAEMFRRAQPDIVLLDMMLPGLNGADLLAAIRRQGDTPVIIVSALGDEPDKLGALRYGADDYVVKPFSPKEVVARVHAVLRRTRGQAASQKQLRHERLVVDLLGVCALVEQPDGSHNRLDLTPTEFGLLSTLLQSPNQAFTRSALLEKVMPGSEAFERSIDTHILNLRRKLDAEGIRGVLVTVRSVGYRFQ